MAHRSRRRPVRNPISPEYQEELLATGIVVPLNAHPSFLPGIARVLDLLERSSDSVVAFAVATGRFSNETSAVLVLPDLAIAARVRTAAAYLAGDSRQEMLIRVRALDLVNMIEEATRIEKINMLREPSRPVTTALAPYVGSYGLMPRPTKASIRQRGRLLADAFGDRMRGVIAKFPRVFQQGYEVGWREYDPNEFDEETGDRWGQHIYGLENGLWAFSGLLNRAGFETQVYDFCGCGDPLHLAVCFRRDGVTMAIRIWDGLWRDEGSYDLRGDYCEALAEGGEALPDDAWEAIELEIDDDEWNAIMEGVMYNPPSRRRKKNDLRCRVCGQTCSCLIYGKPVDHAHAPGGILEYPLCKKHEEECLRVHRPVGPDGTWRWVASCGDAACGYCKTKRRLLG